MFRINFSRIALRSAKPRATAGAFKRAFATAPAPMLRAPTRWPYFAIALGAAAYGGWKWYTWHNYPESVAKLLKEGLLAQRLAQPDHKKALGLYIKALKEADALGMAPLSDEYTGIQLKIAEVCEHLGMPREAAFIYMEIMGMYLIAINNKGTTAMYRDHLIKRDLMVTLMLTMVMKDPALRRKMSFPHLEVAMARVAENATESLPVKLNPTLLLDFHDGRIPSLAASISSDNENAWGEFRDEAFALRELFTVACMEQGEFWQAALFKYHSTLLMLSSGFDLGECLLSLTNVGALAYLQALNYESSPESNPEVLNDEGVIPKPDIGLPRPGQAPLPDGYISTSTLDMVKSNTDLPAVFLAESDKFYSSIRSTIDKLSNSKRRSAEVDKACTLAAFGHGVVKLKQGELKAASDLLSEARIRARGCGLDDVLGYANAEIDKLDKIVASGRPLSDFKTEEIPAINVVFWKIDDPELANQHLYQD